MADPAQAQEPGEITGLLQRAARGDREAFDRLFPLVYGELRRLAGSKLRLEREGHTLNPTALVHEAYLRLVDQTRADWRDTRQFFAVASEVMRRILIDYAKRRHAAKRAGALRAVPVDEARDLPIDGTLFSDDQAADLIALDQAMGRLAEFNPRGAQVVQYRFFAGLSIEDVARQMDLSDRSVRRAWTVARAWLRRELETELGRAAGLTLPGFAAGGSRDGSPSPGPP